MKSLIENVFYFKSQHRSGICIDVILILHSTYKEFNLILLKPVIIFKLVLLKPCRAFCLVSMLMGCLVKYSTGG